jgi:hypothetical protein
MSKSCLQRCRRFETRARKSAGFLSRPREDSQTRFTASPGMPTLLGQAPRIASFAAGEYAQILT